MKILGVIPARYNSSRFPAKALADIHGKPMVQHVYEQALKCTSLHKVVVATDDQRIADPLAQAGIPYVMTSTEHRSGTERAIEVVERMEGRFGAVVNIQGDEPFIDPRQIEELTELIQSGAEIASLMRPITDIQNLWNENVVKVVTDKLLKALYFSRQAIPFQRGVAQDAWLDNHPYYQHVGIYAYRSDALDKIKSMGAAGLEQVESLEQLRWLAHGMQIRMGITHFETHGIDTPEDLKKALEIHKQK